MRPGKGSSKTKISFWDAKKMLEKLGVQFDHARTVTKSTQDTLLVVRLYFFTAHAFNNAYSVVSGQPNNTVFAQGNAVEIQIATVVNDNATVSSSLAVTAPPDFDQHMKGCRIDTIVVKGLPAKWFDVDTKSFLDDDDHPPPSIQSAYMHDQHALFQLFSTFGALSAIDVVPPSATTSTTTGADDGTTASSTVSTSHFDAYVQFKTYDGVRAALSTLCDGGSRVLCHTSHVKTFVPLVAHVDTTEYLSDAHIRQRRFAREQRLHDQKAKAAAAIAAERQAKASMEQATALVGSLGDELDKAAADAIQLSSSLAELKAAAAAYAALKAAPTMERVAIVRQALDVVGTCLAKAVRDKEEHEAAIQRAAWTKQVNKAAAAARDLKLARLQKKLSAAKHSFASIVGHVAVVADMAAADEALAVAVQSATTVLNNAEDVQTYLAKLDEDVDEAVHSVDAVVARLEVVDRFYQVERAVKSWSIAPFHVQSLLQTIENEAWGDRTEDVAKRLDDLDEVVQAGGHLDKLVARHVALDEQIGNATPRHEDGENDLRQRHTDLGLLLHRVTDVRDVAGLQTQMDALEAQVSAFLADRYGDTSALKKPRLLQYVAASSGIPRLASSVWIVDNDTGAVRPPKTHDERLQQDMEALRVQVVESQRRELAKERQLRALVLQSMKQPKPAMNDDATS
ncbi:hypothetical protein DYB25_007147 [Aphanomyces astaci]|uniref:Uncharacterized protein n=2 Tax=Aphanomyces astaci TaxID=112090 RepID=A0A397C4B2_APHAT|nr:hypothetical protein DYB25_007147 [Aphanomyces astaci]